MGMFPRSIFTISVRLFYTIPLSVFCSSDYLRVCRKIIDENYINQLKELYTNYALLLFGLIQAGSTIQLNTDFSGIGQVETFKSGMYSPTLLMENSVALSKIWVPSSCGA